MRPEIARLAAKNYPIRAIDIDRSPEIARKYGVEKVPTFIVADAQGRVLARTEGVTQAADLAAIYNKAKLKAIAALDAPIEREAQPTVARTGDDSDDEGKPASDDEPLVNPRALGNRGPHQDEALGQGVGFLARERSSIAMPSNRSS